MRSTDSELIARTQAGDLDAYEELRRRHLDGVARVAAAVANGASEASEFVSEAFTRVLDHLRESASPAPDLAAALQLLVRRIAYERHVSSEPWLDLAELATRREGDHDDSDENIRRAFDGLSEKWQQTLWHAEVEGRPKALLGRALEMTPAEVAAKVTQAGDVLREAYLATGLSVTEPQCQAYAPDIDAYVQGDPEVPAAGELARHIGGCAECGRRHENLLRLRSDLGGVLREVLLRPEAAAVPAASTAEPAAAAPAAKPAAKPAASAASRAADPVVPPVVPPVVAPVAKPIAQLIAKPAATPEVPPPAQAAATPPSAIAPTARITPVAAPTAPIQPVARPAAPPPGPPPGSTARPGLVDVPPASPSAPSSSRTSDVGFRAASPTSDHLGHAAVPGIRSDAPPEEPEARGRRRVLALAVAVAAAVAVSVYIAVQPGEPDAVAVSDSAGGGEQDSAGAADGSGAQDDLRGADGAAVEVPPGGSETSPAETSADDGEVAAEGGNPDDDGDPTTPDDSPQPSGSPSPSDSQPFESPDPTPPTSDDPGTAPRIEAQPADVTVEPGQTATVAVRTSGAPQPTIQWQERVPGGGWADIAGGESGVLQVQVADAGWDGRAYRALATNEVGSVTSEESVLTVEFAPQIAAHPGNTEVLAGDDAVFEASASAKPDITAVQWQVRFAENGSWFDLPVTSPAAPTSMLTLADVDESMDGYDYRAVFTNARGEATSEAATITVVVPEGQ